MDTLNAGDLQLGLLAPVSGSLLVWWIGSTMRKRDLARPLSEGEFLRILDRISKNSQNSRWCPVAFSAG